MPTNVSSCPLCGSYQSSPLYSRSNLSYVMCEECSLVSLSPRPTEEECAHFYEKEYQSHRHSITDYKQAVEGRKRKGFERKRRYLAPLEPYLNSDSRVLEIGSGWGTLLKLIQNTYHSDVLGVEISKLAARVSREHYGLPVENKILKEFVSDYKGEKFDVIIIMHVLEHIIDPGQALQQLSGLLTENGILYIAVPNLMNPDEPLDRYFHFEHVYYFTAFTLTKLLQKNGFKILWNENTHEIKMIVALNNHTVEGIDASIRESDYTKEKIFKTIESHRKKYVFLRVLKRLAHFLLPEYVFIKVRKLTVTILRKLGIIHT